MTTQSAMDIVSVKAPAKPTAAGKATAIQDADAQDFLSALSQIIGEASKTKDNTDCSQAELAADMGETNAAKTSKVPTQVQVETESQDIKEEKNSIPDTLQGLCLMVSVPVISTSDVKVQTTDVSAATMVEGTVKTGGKADSTLLKTGENTKAASAPVNTQVSQNKTEISAKTNLQDNTYVQDIKQAQKTQSIQDGQAQKISLDAVEPKKNTKILITDDKTETSQDITTASSVKISANADESEAKITFATDNSTIGTPKAADNNAGKPTDKVVDIAADATSIKNTTIEPQNYTMDISADSVASAADFGQYIAQSSTDGKAIKSGSEKITAKTVEDASQIKISADNVQLSVKTQQNPAGNEAGANQDSGSTTLKHQESIEKDSSKKTDKPNDNTKEITADYSQIKIEKSHVSQKISVSEEKTLNSTDVASQVSDKVLSTIKEGDTVFKMKLNPEGLGEITVSMTCKDGKVSLEITAQSSQTQQILQQQSGDLKAALTAKNYEVSNLNVVSQTNTQQQPNGSFSFLRDTGSGTQQHKQNFYNYNSNTSEASKENDSNAEYYQTLSGTRLNYKV